MGSWTLEEEDLHRHRICGMEILAIYVGYGKLNLTNSFRLSNGDCTYPGLYKLYQVELRVVSIIDEALELYLLLATWDICRKRNRYGGESLTVKRAYLYLRKT